MMENVLILSSNQIVYVNVTHDSKNGYISSSYQIVYVNATRYKMGR
jgi:hypothetical protein